MHKKKKTKKLKTDHVWDRAGLIPATSRRPTVFCGDRIDSGLAKNAGPHAGVKAALPEALRFRVWPCVLQGGNARS